RKPVATVLYGTEYRRRWTDATERTSPLRGVHSLFIRLPILSLRSDSERGEGTPKAREEQRGRGSKGSTGWGLNLVQCHTRNLRVALTRLKHESFVQQAPSTRTFCCDKALAALSCSDSIREFGN